MNVKIGLYNGGTVELALLDLPKSETRHRCANLSATRLNDVTSIEWIRRPRQDEPAAQKQDHRR
jgi:hypothetical protein